MNILLIDDDRSAMEPFLDLLQQIGGHVVTKKDTYSEALSEFEQAAKKGAWPYDLLILDIQIKAVHGELLTERETLTAGLMLYDRFRSMFTHHRVLILTNVLHRVPEHLHEGPFTKTLDKVEVAGRRLLSEIQHWD